MKFVRTNFKIVILTILTISLIDLAKGQIENPLLVPPIPFYNQKVVFADQYHSPTMPEQIPLANFTAPSLSHSLFEEDPRRKYRKHDFLDELRFPMYRLTRGETEQVFEFADADRNDILDQGEWDTFSKLYVYPFEACDTNSDYLLDAEEFNRCFDSDPKSKLIVFRRRDQPRRHSMMMETVSSRVKPIINFHEYLFIRRTMFAWKRCQSNAKFIAKSHFKCAMRTAIPQKFHLKIEIDKIYEAGLRTASDKNLIELDYMSYLRIMYFTYVFSVFGAPMNLPYIEKAQWIKAHREDRLPTNYEESEIKLLYDLINNNPLIPVTKMNFSTWAFFYNLHRLFNKYSVDRPLQLQKLEVIEMLKDDLTPLMTKNAIDRARTNFTTPQYQEASLILQRLRPNERQYYFNFKQDASDVTASIWDPKTINATYYDNMYNETNRLVFFSTMCNFNKEYWEKIDYYRAFQLSNLFTSLVPDQRFTVSTTYFVDFLNEQYEKVDPPISLEQRRSYAMYKTLPRDIYLDILTFLVIENYNFKFKSYLKSSNQLVYETFVKLILEDFGMHYMSDEVIDLAKKGYDTLRRRTYDPRELTRVCVIVQAVASEQRRSYDMLKKYNIRLTKEVSRRFPLQPRRFEATERA